MTTAQGFELCLKGPNCAYKLFSKLITTNDCLEWAWRPYVIKSNYGRKRR